MNSRDPRTTTTNPSPTYNNHLDGRPPSPSLYDRQHTFSRTLSPAHTPSTSRTLTNSSSLSSDSLNTAADYNASRGGVQLVEVIAPNATPLARKNGSSSVSIARPGFPESPTLHRATSSINRGQMGTVRTMSMRGKKPTRIVKNLVVAKTDAKSYFSSERTMYAWMYVGTIILGISLTIYRYISTDEKLTMISGQTGTLLSGLSLVVFYYAAIHFFWRRRALNRGAEAQAFDDKLGPILVVTLLCLGLTVNMLLTWINPFPHLKVKLSLGSFAGRPAANETHVNPRGD